MNKNEDVRPKREVMTNEKGEVYIRHYNEKYKMWVNIYSDPVDHSATEYVKKHLKKYI